MYFKLKYVLILDIERWQAYSTTSAYWFRKPLAMQQYSAHLINLYSLQMGLSYNWLGHICYSSYQ